MPQQIRPPERVTIRVESDGVLISDHRGEIIYWSDDEWIQDPAVVGAIVNAVRIGLVDGADALRETIQPVCPIPSGEEIIAAGQRQAKEAAAVEERQTCTLCDESVALPDRRAHLEAHDPHAAEMTAEEVIGMYTGGS